jgi:hypothetical protein
MTNSLPPLSSASSLGFDSTVAEVLGGIGVARKRVIVAEVMR